jgi:hypothetical protein
MPVQDITAEIEGKQYKIRMDIPKGSPPEAIQGAVGEWFQTQQTAKAKNYAPPIAPPKKSGELGGGRSPDLLGRVEEMGRDFGSGVGKKPNLPQGPTRDLDTGLDYDIAMAGVPGEGAAVAKYGKLAAKSVGRGLAKGLEEINVLHPQTAIIKALKEAAGTFREGAKDISKGRALAESATEAADKVEAQGGRAVPGKGPVKPPEVGPRAAPAKAEPIPPPEGKLPSGRTPGKPGVEPTPPPAKAPRASDPNGFYETHARMDKVFRAADDLFKKGITAKHLESLTPAQRAEALGKSSGETFQHILFRLRGLETGKVRPFAP